MPDVADFAALFSSLKAITDLAKLLIDARDAGVVRAKAIELQHEIIATQQGALAAQAEHSVLLKQVSDLEKKVAELKAWDAEKQKYELKAVGYRGGLAYALKQGVDTTEPEHFLCTNCHQEGNKSILQKEMRVPNLTEVLVCPRCIAEVYLTGERDPRHASPKQSSRRTGQRN